MNLYKYSNVLSTTTYCFIFAGALFVLSHISSFVTKTLNSNQNSKGVEIITGISATDKIFDAR